LGLKSPAVCL